MSDPTIKSARIAALDSKWSMCDSLFGGTSTMRAAGVAYLPRNPKEDEADWIVRLNRTTLFNAFKRSVQQAAARVFADDIKLLNFPGEVTIFSDDVDAQGRDITQFCKSVFVDALVRGVSYVLIDFQRREEQPLTLADAIASGDRPYWVPVQATQLLAAHSTFDGGVERLTHFRFYEHITDVSEDGLEEKQIAQVKSFTQKSKNEPVTYTIYRKTDAGWQIYDEGALIGIPQIPVVPIYTNRTGFYIGSPPLMDLAETNVAHWQSTSEQTNILHVARVPFLHIKGIQAANDKDGNPVEFELNVRKALTAGEDAKWVETSGASLAAGREDLIELQSRMDQLGLSLVSPRSGGTTATENSINAAEANSLLKDMALALSDSLEQAIWLTSFYLGIPETVGTVEVSTKFAVDLVTTSETPTEEPTAAPKPKAEPVEV